MPTLGTPWRGPWLARQMRHPVLRHGWLLVLVSARGARQAAHRRRQLRLLEAAYPTVRRSLALDPGWRVHRVLSTVGDVTVALVGGPTPAVVLKWARSARGTAALERAGAVVDALASDARLAGLAHLLPRRQGATRAADGHLVVLETLLPGEDGRTCLTPTTQGEVVGSALGCVSLLHERTATETTIDQELLARWVDDPVAVLNRWFATGGQSRAPALDRLRDQLYRGLLGRDVKVGWIHGDLAPGNVLVRPGTCQVSGLLDWERATAVGLPEVDVMHLRLTVQMHLEGRELGELVCHRLDRLVTAAPDDAGGDPALVLLCWLHHVSGIVAKSDRFPTRGLWAALNVDTVLAWLETSDARLPASIARSRAGR